MNSSNIRELLSAFSPAQDFLAISSADGRVKIWDTVKGQLQTEFAELALAETDNFFGKPESGHLSMDYKCMKWLSLDKKKKRKLGTSLLILGTGSGDVLALDVAAGHLKWRVNDCHPGGVTAVSIPSRGSCIYTAGADGMVSELDSYSGSLLRKFRACTKAISSMSVSADGKLIATAAGQLKIFNNSDQRKLQKFSGHPGSTRCIVFSDDGKYVLSSAVGERYIAVWMIDGSKTKTACCSLAMDHPAIYLDCKLTNPKDTESSGLCVLAISEVGICYFFQGQNIEELRNSKPTKICVSFDDIPKKYKESLPIIFAAKLQTVAGPASGHVFLAYGLPVKPSFEKIVVHSGTDIRLNSSLNGMLLPISQSLKSKKKKNSQNLVTALDRANAEDALLPVPKVLDFPYKKTGVQLVVSRDDLDNLNADFGTFCMEDRLRSLGLITPSEDLASSPALDSSMLNDITLETCVPQKKMKASILSMTPGEAYSLLKVLLSSWQSRSYNGKYVLSWVYCILVNHHDYIVSQEPMTHLLDSLYKLSKSKGDSIRSLLQLSGCLQLVMAQIHKATTDKGERLEHDEMLDESEEEEDVDEVMYGVEEDSETSEDE
ncbi:hypothetical protein LIER_05577 [Lithospermum erythrorhizon]|uniref:Small-subunit processome Utp12 domain-containing protein n=1 Tax=Lithospermum erythrorhizon TaxID=34254 RepID=A0AAV3P1B0_LITER